MMMVHNNSVFNDMKNVWFCMVIHSYVNFEFTIPYGAKNVASPIRSIAGRAGGVTPMK